MRGGTPQAPHARASYRPSPENAKVPSRLTGVVPGARAGMCVVVAALVLACISTDAAPGVSLAVDTWFTTTTPDAGGRVAVRRLQRQPRASFRGEEDGARTGVREI